MILLEAQPPLPDGVFYYSLSILFAITLIGIIYRYAEKTSKLLDELVKNDVRQDVTLSNHTIEIQELKKSRVSSN